MQTLSHVAATARPPPPPPQCPRFQVRPGPRPAPRAPPFPASREARRSAVRTPPARPPARRRVRLRSPTRPRSGRWRCRPLPPAQSTGARAIQSAPGRRTVQSIRALPASRGRNSWRHMQACRPPAPNTARRSGRRHRQSALRAVPAQGSGIPTRSWPGLRSARAPNAARARVRDGRRSCARAAVRSVDR